MPPDAEYVFITQDWQGRTVRMSVKDFDTHQKYRPMMVDYVVEVRTAIVAPDIVQDADSGAVRLSRLRLGRGVYANTWLSVVVYYDVEPGVVATYMFARHRPNDAILETRAVYVNGERFQTARGGA